MWLLSILSLCLCKRGKLIREYKNSTSRKDTDSLKQKTDSKKLQNYPFFLHTQNVPPERTNLL